MRERRRARHPAWTRSVATASAPSVGAPRWRRAARSRTAAGSGIEVRRWRRVTLDQVVVRRNGGFGVSARTPDGARRAIALDAERLVRRRRTARRGSSCGRSSRRRAVHGAPLLRSGRTARAPPQATEFASGRRAGGVYLYGTPPASLVFQGNTIYANANSDADVVRPARVRVAGAAWDLSGAASCGALANVFACPATARSLRRGRPASARTGPRRRGSGPRRSVTNAGFDPTCAVRPASMPERTP